MYFGDGLLPITTAEKERMPGLLAGLGTFESFISRTLTSQDGERLN